MAGLYLASQSPRRTELLTQVGIDHTVVSSTYEESNEGYDNPIEMVKAQALGKARCAVGVPDRSIVLGADTIVVLDNKVLGKPHDESDARHMLEHLSGRAHSVITGVALLIKGEEIVFHNVYQWNIASLVALHNLSTVFRYDNDVVVFVNRNHDI